jgi:MoaA/NifB/PqqE/SkfB family radical SAM enzyme
MNGINHLIASGYTKDLHNLTMDIVACQANYKEIPTIWKWAKQKQIIPFVTRLQPLGRAANHKNLLLGASELQTLFKELSKIDSAFGKFWTTDIPWCGGTMLVVILVPMV